MTRYEGTAFMKKINSLTTKGPREIVHPSHDAGCRVEASVSLNTE
jgi:hypothetical protein